ncbi:MAG: arylsulfatase, partial [Rikenellaceae bacterium]
TIAQGSQSDHISAFWDLMPTFAELAGTPLSTPTDGISFVDELLGKEQREHDFLFWEYNDGGGAMAVRMGDWKAIRTGINKDVNSPIELYNLSEDVGETTDLAAQYPDLVDKADLIMQREHIKNDDFPFKHEKQQPEVQN